MLKEGDVIMLNNGDKVYADIPEALIYSESACIWDIMVHAVINIGDYGFQAGKYIVYKEIMEGGSEFSGYPDGHHVFCVNAECDRIKVDFYESGCFAFMLKEKEVIGRAKQIWTIE